VLNFYHGIFENCNILFYVSPGKPKVGCQKRFFARSARESRTSTPHLQNRCATFAYTVMIIVLVSLLGLVCVLSRNLWHSDSVRNSKKFVLDRCL